MKLTLQLVVVVLNAQTNFWDNLLKFTLYTIEYTTEGSTHAMLPFQHNIFHEILTPTVDRRNRIASDIQPIKLFPLKKLTNSADFDKLEGYNPKKPKLLAPRWPGQINVRPSK